MKTTYKVLIFILTVFIFLFYQYYRNVLYLDKLTYVADVILRDYRDFCSNYYDCIPQKKSDLEIMLEWIEASNGAADNPIYDSILENGLGIRYDSILKTSIIYSYGQNGEDDSLRNTPYNIDEVDDYGQYPIYRRGILTFWDNLFANNDVDIKLFKFEESLPNCPKYDEIEGYQYLDRQFEIYKGSKKVFGDSHEENFRHSILNFAYSYDRDNPEESVKDFGPLLLMYKKDKLIFICDGGLSKKSKIHLLEELEEYFSKHDMSYLDYAFFPMYIPEM